MYTTRAREQSNQTEPRGRNNKSNTRTEPDTKQKGGRRGGLSGRRARDKWWGHKCIRCTSAHTIPAKTARGTSVKTRERRGSSFSQLGLEPNHTSLTAQSLFFVEESCRVKRSDTQTFSNFSNYFKRVLKLPKTFFQLLQIKRLQLKLTNNLQNSYQISSQHQAPKSWVKQHPKTLKTTKTNENPSPSSSMHKLVPFGSKSVSTWFL